MLSLEAEAHMKTRHTRSFFLLIFVTLLTLGIAPRTPAQNSKPNDGKDKFDELLAEVRMLRQALQTIQQINVDTYRSQLLVDRIRVNREDVRRLTNTLNETRDTLAKTQDTIPQFIEQQKLYEGQLQSEVEPKRRAQLEFELRRNKQMVEMYKSQIEPMKEREQQLTTDLNVEKAKLQELESRLDLLERSIENDRQKLEPDKPASAKTP